MSRVELVYDHDCPNAGLARQRLDEAFAEAGFTGQWIEWERSQPGTPDHAKRYGSPTILVDGADVIGEDTSVDASSCRVFVQDDGSFAGAPPVSQITEALRGVATGGASGTASAGAAATSAGAALTAGVAAACCAGPVIAPLVVAILGASGAAWAAGLKPYTVPMLIVAAVLICTSAWMIYRPIDLGHGLRCKRRPSRSARAALGFAGVVWVTAVAVNAMFNS